MPLTDAQKTTLGNDIRANTNLTVIDALATGSNNALKGWYNGQAVPDFWVFKGSVSVDAITAVMDWSANYAVFKDDMPAISFLLQNGSYDPRPVKAREALTAVFAGAGATQNAILVESTRLSSEAEKLFSSATTGPGGGGGSTQGTSAVSAFEGELSLQDIRDALSLTAP